MNKAQALAVAQRKADQYQRRFFIWYRGRGLWAVGRYAPMRRYEEVFPRKTEAK